MLTELTSPPVPAYYRTAPLAMRAATPSLLLLCLWLAAAASTQGQTLQAATAHDPNVPAPGIEVGKDHSAAAVTPRYQTTGPGVGPAAVDDTSAASDPLPAAVEDIDIYENDPTPGHILDDPTQSGTRNGHYRQVLPACQPIVADVRLGMW